ncbi:hypothetical protein K437DRAFT_259393 [Tilletiaria anomala UBC 951]|uniref:DNA replication complex GINS protein PSF1 n=1 Tax=Tilletiaria anomala (strain ATCC 24038 / CBS 436.72 / UBC 951) TaxID=1037660 RepID=A0A066VIP4_TILAU|nr:uncharacterized protein K437DRAFT_259393 [Tilletiaria anomala UBC 951]KDN38445.1 hypothetical protein K437DRAFT_259393 [Tilletiaria anomala UBC 951]
MFGDLGLSLVAECRSSEATGTIRPYNDELVRMVMLETRQLQEIINTLLSNVPGGADEADRNPALAAQLVTHHLSALRNKRCLLAYHRFRMQWLQRRLWSTGGTLDLVLNDDQGGSQGLRHKLSPAELSSLRSYAALVTSFKGEYLDVMDICASLSSDAAGPGPPKELMVTVVAQVDAADVMTEGGTLNLRKGEPMRVRRSEIEPLLLRGWVAILD